eukprot:CAMPEP_0171997502 /NCGR_PEP_ID=MMETSP1041-20130122/726_1 /TAXON_ID=464988 /ORGANISM="Hemiselmis andersenii, Strain CCMP439" /LENGTH=45 /DNA_ID= /DNA_START= /DNA_END= /DNA_ORIENTATION=
MWRGGAPWLSWGTLAATPRTASDPQESLACTLSSPYTPPLARPQA